MAPSWEEPSFWLTNIREKSAAELLKILSLKDRKKLAKTPPSKGGVFLRRVRLRNLTNHKGKGEKVPRNGNMLRSTGGVGQGLIHSSDLGEISTSDVLTALEEEPEESKNLPFSESTKGGLFLLNEI